MGFFEPPPPPDAPDEPDDYRRPAWLGPPENELGCPVPLRLVLARTAEVAIAVVGGAAFRSGFEVSLTVVSRSLLEAELDPGLFMHRPYRRGGEPGIPHELLRFGVELADGTKATNVAPWLGGGPDEPPPGPVLNPGSGGGGGRNWRSDYWLWPLPPPGPIAFVCEWPAQGVELTRVEVDAEPIREAASRSEVLWPDEPAGGLPTQASSHSVRSVGGSSHGS
jgi:hypothetical protein